MAFKLYSFRGPNEPVILDTGSDRLQFQHGATGLIPCKPTHPNVTLSLQRMHLYSVDDMPKVLLWHLLTYYPFNLFIKTASILPINCRHNLNEIYCLEQNLNGSWNRKLV